MNRFFLLILTITFSCTFSAMDVSAQRGIPKMNRRLLLDSLSPEQKKEFRKNLRARYDSLSPEQKEKFKARILNRADSTLSPQQKARLRKRLKNNQPETVQ
jgi:hypothetical protein